MSRERKRQELRRKLGPKMKLEYRHAGASCPACGYVFNLGFSTYSEQGRSSCKTGETFTVCTRCRRVLIVADSGAIRLLDETGKLLLTPDDLKSLDIMRELLEVAGYDDLS